MEKGRVLILKEQLYTIPVNDAFDKDCECPVCEMYHVLQYNTIDFIMGPSYMEDDVRMVTNKIGFCEKHLKLLYLNQNRLGLSLMLLTHMDKVIKETEKAAKSRKPSSAGLFKKKEQSDLEKYIHNLEDSCYVCDRMSGMFSQYIETVIYLYNNDSEFKKKLNKSKGFCNKHYIMLYESASKHLRGQVLDDFINDINRLYLENIKRVRDDLEWFTDKFDYRYVNEPWKNSKDALPRAMQKLNGIRPE